MPANTGGTASNCHSNWRNTTCHLRFHRPQTTTTYRSSHDAHLQILQNTVIRPFILVPLGSLPPRVPRVQVARSEAPLSGRWCKGSHGASWVGGRAREGIAAAGDVPLAVGLSEKRSAFICTNRDVFDGLICMAQGEKTLWTELFSKNLHAFSNFDAFCIELRNLLPPRRSQHVAKHRSCTLRAWRFAWQPDEACADEGQRAST